MRLILASTSPRRRELLTLLGIPFDVIAPDPSAESPDDLPAVDPAQRARVLAERKARSVAERFPDTLVLGSDTLITIGSDVLGKPADVGEAEEMLRRLRGREHVIHTAVALLSGREGRMDSAVESVRVRMKPLTDREVRNYAGGGEGLGKAGGYAIQGEGAKLIARISGDFPAAVGLPLRLVAEMLRAHGLRVPVEVEELYRTKPYPNWDRFVS
jgi:septum formation protein